MPLNGHPTLSSRIRAQCFVDLLSRVQRPWLFKVTVWSPDRLERRVYEIPALSDDDAANTGLKRYTFEMTLKGLH